MWRANNNNKKATAAVSIFFFFLVYYYTTTITNYCNHRASFLHQSTRNCELGLSRRADDKCISKNNQLFT